MQIQRSNTILYCERFADMVAFYRDVLRLDVAFENEWFVEFSLGSGAFLSVADATRASIRSGDGRGLTMSWRVADVHEARAALIASGVDAAREQLESLGFVVEVKQDDDFISIGFVVRQSPGGGDQQPRGAAVTLYVI